MLAKAHFLFVDVVLLQVEDHFLLEALGVGFGRQFFDGLGEFFANGLDAFAFEGFYAVVEGKDAFHTRSDVFVQGDAFGGAVVHELSQGAVKGIGHKGPFVGADDIGLAGIHDVGEAEDGGGKGGGIGRGTQRGDGAGHVLAEGGFVDAVRTVPGGGLEGCIEVDGATYEFIGQQFTYFQLLVFGEEGGFDIDVGAFAVEGADFKGEGAARKKGFGLAVTRHGLNHSCCFFAVQRYKK